MMAVHYDRETLSDEAEACADTVPPPADVQPTAHLARLLPPLAEKHRAVAEAMREHERLADEWDRSRALYSTDIQDARNKACRPLADIVPALEEVEREAARLGLSAELADCLVTESQPRTWTLTGSALALLDLRRMGDGVAVETLDSRGQQYAVAARQLAAWAEDLA
jgi:hypothetical protein